MTMNPKKYIINDMEYNVAVNSLTADKAEVTVNGVTYQVKIEKARETAVSSQVTDAVPVMETAPVTATPATVAPAGTGSGKPVNSPLPGVIVDIKVKVGDSVREGQVVAILEAMKMENEIQSEYSGTVTSVNVSQGDSILEGAPIVTIG